MIKNRFLKFMAPNDGGEGGTAVAEAPAETTFDRFEQAMEKERGAENSDDSDPDKGDPKPDVKAKPDKVAKAAPAAEAKTAIEAALDKAEEDGKKATEVVPATNEFADIEKGIKNPEQVKNVVAMRESLEKTRATVADLTTKLKAAESQVGKPDPRVAELETQLAQYKDAITALDVSYDPEIREKFVVGRDKIIGKAASKLDAFGGNGDDLKTALSMPEGRSRTQAIKEALGELEDVERNRVLQLVGEVEKLDDEFSELKKDPQQAWDKLQKNQTAQAQARAAEAEKFKSAEFDRVSKLLTDTSPLLRTVAPTVGGADEWNGEIKTAMDSAKHLLGNSATLEEIASAAIKGARYDAVEKMFLETRKQLKLAKTELAELQAAEPSITGGRKQPDAKHKDAADRYEEAISQIRAEDE